MPGAEVCSSRVLIRHSAGLENSTPAFGETDSLKCSDLKTPELKKGVLMQ